MIDGPWQYARIFIRERPPKAIKQNALRARVCQSYVIIFSPVVRGSILIRDFYRTNNYLHIRVCVHIILFMIICVHNSIYKYIIQSTYKTAITRNFFFSRRIMYDLKTIKQVLTYIYLE